MHVHWKRTIMKRWTIKLLRWRSEELNAMGKILKGESGFTQIPYICFGTMASVFPLDKSQSNHTHEPFEWKIRNFYRKCHFVGINSFFCAWCGVSFNRDPVFHSHFSAFVYDCAYVAVQMECLCICVLTSILPEYFKGTFTKQKCLPP